MYASYCSSWYVGFVCFCYYCDVVMFFLSTTHLLCINSMKHITDNTCKQYTYLDVQEYITRSLNIVCFHDDDLVFFVLLSVHCSTGEEIIYFSSCFLRCHRRECCSLPLAIVRKRCGAMYLELWAIHCAATTTTPHNDKPINIIPTERVRTLSYCKCDFVVKMYTEMCDI